MGTYVHSNNHKQNTKLPCNLCDDPDSGQSCDLILQPIQEYWQAARQLQW